MLTNQGVFRVRKAELEDFAAGRLRARGADGTWSPTEAFELVLLPTRYQQPSFYVVLVVALAFLGWVVHRLRVRSLLRYNRRSRPRTGGTGSAFYVALPATSNEPEWNPPEVSQDGDQRF